MKKILLLAFSLFIFQSITSQEKNGVAFINADFNLTFRVNENFEFGNDNDESFFIPSEVLLRFGFGYEYKKRIAVSFNAGLTIILIILLERFQPI